MGILPIAGDDSLIVTGYSTREAVAVKYNVPVERVVNNYPCFSGTDCPLSESYTIKPIINPKTKE